jgi:hypothetical protein
MFHIFLFWVILETSQNGICLVGKSLPQPVVRYNNLEPPNCGNAVTCVAFESQEPLLTGGGCYHRTSPSTRITIPCHEGPWPRQRKCSQDACKKGDELDALKQLQITRAIMQMCTWPHPGLWN